MKKKLIALTICLFVVFGMVGCSATQQSESSAPATSAPAASVSAADEASAAAAVSDSTAKKRTIGFIMIAGSIEHCRTFDQAIKDVAAEHGDEVATLDANLDVTAVSSLVDDLIAKKVDGIIIEGFDQEAHIGAIKAANAAGIAVVQSDNWCSDETITVGQAASDNYDAGYQCGLDACKKLGGGQNVKAIMLTNPGSPAADDRTGGFKAAVEENGGTILVEQKASGADVGAQVTDDLLQAYPETNAIMANHDPAAMGALASVKSVGKVGEILIYGVDGNSENLAAIKAGEISGTALQDPYTMGKESANFLYNYWGNVADYEKHVIIPITFVNSDNVDEFLK